jgi:hypothetical protein
MSDEFAFPKFLARSLAVVLLVAISSPGNADTALAMDAQSSPAIMNAENSLSRAPFPFFAGGISIAYPSRSIPSDLSDDTNKIAPTSDTASSGPIFFDNMEQTSPDGSQMVLVSAANLGMDDSTIWVSNPEKTEKRMLLSGDPDGWISSPVWSPDGSELAYLKIISIPSSSYESGTRFELWAIQSDGTNNRLITDTQKLNPLIGYGGKADISWNMNTGEIEFVNHAEFPIRRYSIHPVPRDIKEIAVEEIQSEGYQAQPSGVPHFYQTDGAWSGDQLGTCSTTIGDEGCALTSTAMVFAYYGVNTNPGALNTWLKSINGYDYDCVLNWIKAALIDSSIEWIPGTARDFNRLRSELDLGYPIILHVNNGGQMHFVVATGYSGNTYYINDPLYSSRTSLDSYGNDFVGMRVYHGPIGTGGDCPGPSLNGPSDGFVSTSQTISFSWSAPGGCTFEGYTFRIKDTSNMDSGGNTIVDTGNSLTSRTETIDSQWNNRDLYWGVRTANPLSPNWSVRRFRIEPGGGSCSGPSLTAPFDGYVSSSQTVNFGWNPLSGCTFNGYTFRIKDTNNMDSGGSTIVDTGEGGTSRTETINTQWNNRDLYWGVKAANAPNGASWSVRRFRIEPGGGGCVPESDQVALFADADFGGSCVVRSYGDYPNPASLGIANDSTSSIKVGSNAQAILCQHDDFLGTCETFTGDDANLSDNAIGDNQVSSASVTTRPNNYPVTLYVHANYIGDSCALMGPGWSDVCDGYDDTASSIRIQSGWSARVWADSEMQGASRCITGDISDFSGLSYNENGSGSLNDSISSFAAYQQTGCPPLPPSVPENFRVAGTTDDSITLAWDDVSNEEGYFIYKWQYLDGVWDFYYHTSLGANTLSFTDTSLQCGSDYFYKISAYNASGESNHSGWIAGTTGACPPRPDLAITTFYATAVEYTNQDIHIWMELTNWTDEASSGFWVDVYVDDQPTACSDWGSYWIRHEGLAGNASEWWSVTIPAGVLSAGSHTIRAFIDSGCEINESSEDNNMPSPIALAIGNPPADPPVHDDIAAAKIITYMGYADITDVRGATRAADDPAAAECGLAPGMSSVWYRYTPATDQTLVLDTFASDYDTYIAAWSGTRGNLIPVGCNDDYDYFGGVYQSELQVSLTGGVTYYFEVAEYSWGVTALSSSKTVRDKEAKTADQPADLLDGKITHDQMAQAGGTLHFHASIVPPPPPGEFGKVSPADSAYTNTGPTLAWEESSHAEYYIYCVDTIDNGVCDTAWENAGSSTNTTLSGLSPYVTYYWSVASTNATETVYADSGIWWSIKVLPQSFVDVPDSYWAWSWIERLFHAGITGGCGGGNYCPSNPVTRAEMAIFLERGIHGSPYTPPAAGGTMFADVPLSHWAADWIEALYADGITGGCGGGNYCPSNPVTRAEMAIFLLRSKYGSSYTPPAASGMVFGDVPVSHWAAAWIEQLSAEGITGGCGEGNYCPNNPVTRAEMAVFLVRTFGLP